MSETTNSSFVWAIKVNRFTPLEKRAALAQLKDLAEKNGGSNS